MRRWIAAAAGLAALALAGPLGAVPDNYDAVERGRYLVTVGDCVACHLSQGTTVGNLPTGGAAFAGGRAIETPFGNIVAANITPDRETGIGTWSEDQFYRAMHHGVRANGDRLYPAFPYTYYTRVTRRDADAIYAFLRTLEPVRNPVDRNALPFPLDIRAAMIGWNALFFEPGEFRPDPARSEEWNRGAYLVEGLGHCGACHTPKNRLGGDRESLHLAGGPIQGWYAPSLTGDERTGIGAWSVEEIVQYLRDGRNARSAASGPMAEVVQYSTSRMTEPDLRAMAAYLRDPPRRAAPAAPPAALAADDARMRAGEALYVDRCMACHRRDGAGVPGIFPRLAGSQVVQQEGTETLLRIVIQGTRAAYSPHAPTAPAMPAFGWRLDDTQVAAVVAFVRNAWGNAASPPTPDDARRMRELLHARTE